MITLFADGVTVGVHPPNLRLLLFGVPIVVLTCNMDWLLFTPEEAVGRFFRLVE